MITAQSLNFFFEHLIFTFVISTIPLSLIFTVSSYPLIFTLSLHIPLFPLSLHMFLVSSQLGSLSLIPNSSQSEISPSGERYVSKLVLSMKSSCYSTLRSYFLYSNFAAECLDIKTSYHSGKLVTGFDLCYHVPCSKL